MIKKLIKSDEEWKKILTPLQYNILREKGTESPFSGSLLGNKEKGIYLCVACGNILFSSDKKYDSGTGWPSFWDLISKDSVEIIPIEVSYSEILCARCEGHIGHLFFDGPLPTGKRYCINSAVLRFTKSKK